MNTAVSCLSFGLAPAFGERIDTRFPGLVRVELPFDMDGLSSRAENAPELVLCGLPPAGMQAPEVAQLLRMEFRDIPIYLVADANSRFDRKALIKNGFTDVFFMPIDQEILDQAIESRIAVVTQGGKSYRSVKLIDLQPESELDFDAFIYMPMNGKYIKYISAGDKVEQKQVERLKCHKMTSMYVDEQELPKFYSYTAKVLKSIGSNAQMSETERAEKLHTAVRDLVSGLFSDSTTAVDLGKKAIEDCQNVIRSYVKSGSSGSWYDRIQMAVASGSGAYSNATAISTYAGLFGIALNLPTVEDLAMAGLLHDIGLAKVRAEILAKDPSSWTETEKAEYQKHAEHSIDMIRERKLVVSDLVHSIILQHHEKLNGSGYPKGIRGSRMCIEAKVLAAAACFHELVRVAPGKPRRSPSEAMREMKRMFASDPTQEFIEPELLRKLLDLFPEDPAAEPSQRAA